MKKRIPFSLFLICLFSALLPPAYAQDADEIVKASFHYYRGKTSVIRVDMTVHRPDWERVFTIRAWTEGEDRSLFRIASPARDRGNGTLKRAPRCGCSIPRSTG